MSTPASRTCWRLITPVVTTVAAALALAGCAEPTPVVTGGGTVAPATTAAAPSASGPSTPRPSATATTPPSWPTRTLTVGKTLTDTGLGHTVKVTRILRGLPWPAGYVATSQAYELVAVEMTWTPSTTYTAPLRRQDFALRTGAPFPSRPTALIDGPMRAHRLIPLPTQVSGSTSRTGWLVFKVDPKAAPNLTLAFTRPKAQVSGSGQVFDTRVFGLTLVGSPVATG